MNRGQKNVLGGNLEPCCLSPRTGFYRDGWCHVGEEDLGIHAVCAEMTAAFLQYSKQAGNDLSTPREEFGFPGLKPGDRWCICAARWQQALEAGAAPPVVLTSTSEAALELIQLEDLLRAAIDRN